VLANPDLSENTCGVSAVGDSGEELARLRATVEGLQRAMQSRAVIEQAIGLLVGVYGTDPDTAFERLVRLSQHHNVKLRRMAAVLVELTAEAGGAHAGSLVARLEAADPLIDLLEERNHKRGHALNRELPGAAIEAARALVAARDARDQGDDTENAALTEQLTQARVLFYQQLIELGWVPPLPIPVELGETFDQSDTPDP
jgi:transposase